MTTKKVGVFNCDTMEKRETNRERDEMKNMRTTHTKEVNVSTNNGNTKDFLPIFHT